MNIIKKFQKKQKRKKLMRQKARLAQEQAAQEGSHYGRTSHRRRISRKGKKVITAAVIAAAVCLVFLYAEKRSYHSYKVLNTSEQEDVVSTQYVDMDGDILRYSPDGVSVVDNSMNTIWNETYTMQNPIADVNGSRAVVADSEGTFGGAPTSYYDLWRIENGKIAEHWDVMETIAEKSTWQNQNGKF